jgi:hypothetical protein
MRVTLDSNVWQMVVRPEFFPNHQQHEVFLALREALRSNVITGFISETVGTLEGIENVGRASYFTSIRPKVEIKSDMNGNDVHISLQIGAYHEQHPSLKPILREQLEAAFALGIQLMRAPRIGVPIPEPFLSLEHYAEEENIPVAAERTNRWGDIVEAIELRGVGGAILKAMKQRGELSNSKQFARAVAEWADGDSVALHIAYNNDVFCTEDQGKSAGVASILNEQNRLWLHETYGMRFATIAELAQQGRWG